MTELAHTHKVNICGENFQIKSDVPGNVIEKIAGYVDYKIKEVSSAVMNGEKLRVAVLASMNIAGELFDAKKKLEELEEISRQVEAKSEFLSESLDLATKTVHT